MGEGIYSGERKWKAQISENVFEIVPTNMPTGKHFAVGVLIMVLACSMAGFMASKGSYIIATGIVLFGVFTTIFSIMLNRAEYRSAQKRGTVFRYDRKTGEITLPDRNLTFGVTSHLSFAFIISDFYSSEGTGESKLSELQLVFEIDGKTDRYVLAQGLDRDTLMPLVTEVQKNVPLPIREIEHGSVLGQKKIYEKIFGQD
ncbi:MAG TPA: hypothetical protein VGH19_15670 [Verrucomicrobiae bacterium]